MPIGPARPRRHFEAGARPLVEQAMRRLARIDVVAGEFIGSRGDEWRAMRQAHAGRLCTQFGTWPERKRDRRPAATVLGAERAQDSANDAALRQAAGSPGQPPRSSAIRSTSGRVAGPPAFAGAGPAVAAGPLNSICVSTSGTRNRERTAYTWRSPQPRCCVT
jgi:hypothetical protein